MYYTMLEKAVYLITEYQIFEYPIPVHIIEQVISDHDIKIIMFKNLNRTCLMNGDILTCKCSLCSEYRCAVVHEAGHALFQKSNYYRNDFLINAKNEAQANAFAAYFLMPVYVFEEALKYTENDFELAEEFGVTADFVKFRKKLTEGLMADGYFNELV